MDTTRGVFPGIACSDCGEKKVIFKHWGPLVPAGKVGYFCEDCMSERREYFQTNGIPKPLEGPTPSGYAPVARRKSVEQS